VVKRWLLKTVTACSISNLVSLAPAVCIYGDRRLTYDPNHRVDLWRDRFVPEGLAGLTDKPGAGQTEWPPFGYTTAWATTPYALPSVFPVLAASTVEAEPRNSAAALKGLIKLSPGARNPSRAKT